MWVLTHQHLHCVQRTERNNICHLELKSVNIYFTKAKIILELSFHLTAKRV